MSYRLRPGSAFGKDVRRVAREQFEKCAAILEAGEGDRDEAIHAARKRFKKVRGLYRLIRSGASDSRKRENARIRDITAALSGVRDAAALIEAVDGLAAHLSSGTVPEELTRARAALVLRRDRLVGGQVDVGQRMAAAAEGCRQAMAALDDLDLDVGRKEAAGIVADGWRRTGKRAARALDACRTQAADDDFHTLRKRAKDHVMHVRLLRDIWPTMMKLRRREAEILAGTIGGEHDLSILQNLIRDEPQALGDIGSHQLLERLVADRRGELRAASLTRSARLFGEPAKREAKRVDRLWRDAASRS